MNEPRRGDTVILKTMVPTRVEKVNAETVACRAGGRLHQVKLRDLECIDPDDGLWQQMESRRP